MKPLLVLSSIDSGTGAQALAEHLLEQKLAACVSISPPWTSHYTWEGKRECAKEHLILIKTLSKNREALVRELRKVHPYDCPEVLILEADAGNPAYAEWMLQQCGGQ